MELDIISFYLFPSKNYDYHWSVIALCDRLQLKNPSIDRSHFNLPRHIWIRAVHEIQVDQRVVWMVSSSFLADAQYFCEAEKEERRGAFWPELEIYVFDDVCLQVNHL